MFVVEDLQNLKMNVKISEYDISKIQVGQKVTITAEVLGDDSVQGIVSRISPTGEQKDTTSTEMVIPVQIDVNKENPL
jgi:multidrug resistance efflux pump